jgi:hypothetical protein
MLATISERLVLPPVGVVADLGALLFGASLGALRVRADGVEDGTRDPGLASAVRRYEDALLGRLATDARIASAGMAVLRLPAELHPQAVGVLVSGVLASIGYGGGLAMAPGTVRTLTERTPTETVRRGFSSLRNDAETRRRLRDDYVALASCAQRAREVLRAADLFALENLAVLGSLAQRLAIAEVVRAAEAMTEALPRSLPRRARKRGASATRLLDENVYPAGGFGGVSTSGSLENLVTSELVYMDPPHAPPGASAAVARRERPDVDLFDVRLLEGELLYYTRDEAIHVRRRRIVVVALDPSLVRARVKDPEAPWQRLVAALGVLFVVTQQLAALLEEESLTIEVAFLRDAEGLEPLGEERGLVRLLLREWIDRHVVDVTVRTWADVLESARDRARSALVDVVWMAEGASREPEPPRPPAEFLVFPVERATPERWIDSAKALLSALL